MNWPTNCVRPQEPLSSHTSFRIGGPAEWYAEPQSIDELLAVLREARRAGLPVSAIGGGTNLLVADRGVRGLVLRLGAGFRQVTVDSPEDANEAVVRCGASVMTQRLVGLASQHGWAGLELMAGLPGQVGGAVTMNAQNIGTFVEAVTVVTFDGNVKQIPKERLLFTYRYAAIDPGIVVEVALKFPKAADRESTYGIQEALCYRNTTQDLRLPSAGCAFKNPKGQSAGKLIDQTGLKGQRIGDAQVSLRHANFIVNVGQASCDDVLSLMEHIQRRVRSAHGLWLEPEFRVLGERL